MRALIRRLFIVVTVLWLAAMLVIYSDAGSGIIGLFAFVGGVIALGGAMIVQLLLRLLERRGAGPQWRVSRRTQLVAPIALAAAIAMVGLSGPRSPLFRLRFALSERALETRAKALVTTTFQSSAPEWIGWFRVGRINVHDGQVRFITTPCGVVDSCGVVYAPSGSPNRWMEDQFTSLHGAWWHVFEGF